MEILYITTISFLSGFTIACLLMNYLDKRAESKLHQDMSDAFAELSAKVNQL